MMAVACLYVAGKVREQPKKLRDVLPFVYQLLPRYDQASPELLDPNGSLYREMRDMILGYERILLHTLNFDFSFEDPYPFLYKCAKDALPNSREQKKTIVQAAYNFLTDSFATTVCLQYTPQVRSVPLLLRDNHLTLLMCPCVLQCIVVASLNLAARKEAAFADEAGPDASPGVDRTWWQSHLPGVTEGNLDGMHAGSSGCLYAFCRLVVLLNGSPGVISFCQVFSIA